MEDCDDRDRGVGSMKAEEPVGCTECGEELCEYGGRCHNPDCKSWAPCILDTW